MDQNDGSVTVVVLESSRCLMANDLDVDTATTLIALVSEDPANWDEATSVWPRYRTPAVCEFVSSLPMEQTDRDETTKALWSADAWVAIDFRGKRVLTGGQFMPVGRDAAFAMVVDESGKQHCPLSVHLPPWWELHEGVAPGAVNEPRQSPSNKPQVDRDVLYGDAFLANIAARVLDVVASDAWRDSEARDDKQARYPFTIRIHRDWLMTPREDLGGRMPRELLHGAIQWSDRVTFAGKQGGHLKMAFMVAEIVSELETSNASRDEIKAVNECFANYRRCDDEQRPQRASELKANLQSLSDRYPGLVSKSADLQSRIDEAGRSPALNDSDLDFPF